jgi:hypothetical protein
LKDTYRTIVRTSGPGSPLRQLYFQAAIFWGLEFSGGGVDLPKCFYGSGILGLDPEVDRELIAELQRSATHSALAVRMRNKKYNLSRVLNGFRTLRDLLELARWIIMQEMALVSVRKHRG